MKIEQAIQQKTFKDDYHKALLNVIYTATWINKLSSQALKPFALSQQQFNLLRILKGLKGKPATIKLLTERMLDKSSNASRLVDKLMAKNYVERKESPIDRRRVDIWLTDEGLEQVNIATVAIDKMIEEKLTNIDSSDARELSRILDQLRSVQ